MRSKNYVCKQDKVEYIIKIWDTAGQEKFNNLTPNFYKKADGIILAYDITDPISFKKLIIWSDSINENTSGMLPMILVGNKIDIEEKREVT